jgi:hypothetical protein
MTQVKRGGIDQRVSAGAERAREITGIVTIKHSNPCATLDKLLRRRMSATVGDRDIPASGKQFPCDRTANLPGPA